MAQAKTKLKLPQYFPIPLASNAVRLQVQYVDSDGDEMESDEIYNAAGDSDELTFDEAEKFMRTFTRLVRGAMSLNETGKWPDEVTGDFAKVWSIIKESENEKS